MNKVFSIVLFPFTLIRFILVWLVTAFFATVVSIEYLRHKRPGTYKFWCQQHWGRTVLFLLGLKVKRNNIVCDGYYLLMPNHRSYIDILIMAAYSPSAFVSKAEIGKWPIIGPALKWNHAILVQRDELRSLLGTMKLIKASIENGLSVTVFPEGTTFAGPGTKTFKNGTFKIAAEQHINIVPCAIQYADKSMAWVGEDTLIPHVFSHFWKPVSRAEIKFGPPISGTDYQELKTKTQQIINELLGEPSQNH